MINTPDMHEDYYERLNCLSNTALEASNWYGRRRSLGGLVFGNAVAGWRGQDDSLVDLEVAGFQYSDVSITRKKPTTLRIVSTIVKNSQEITTYKMNLKDEGQIEVYRNMFLNGGLVEIMRASMSRRLDKENGLHIPTQGDVERIHSELQRGASGDFVITNHHYNF
jgi:hypothetical protein